MAVTRWKGGNPGVGKKLVALQLKQFPQRMLYTPFVTELPLERLL
jgi:hypothetical protein